MIFETLNARGETAAAADLLRNYIFFRANRDKLDVEQSYKRYWARFDDEFWREEVKQGRLTGGPAQRPLHAALPGEPAGAGYPDQALYVEYRHWIERDQPFPDVKSELEALARQGDQFRGIIAPSEDDILSELCSFLEAFDIRTAYPLLLALADAVWTMTSGRRSPRPWNLYLLRRAVCNLGTKNYNRIFLGLTRALRKEVSAPTS